jgi:transcriptional regulator with XRE-family HTH domain
MSNPAFGRWLTAQLRRREWNESDLARRMERTPSVVNRWARGERTPNPASCDLLADVLGIDRDLVLAVAGHRPEAEPIAEGDPRRRLHALIDAIDWRREAGAAAFVIDALEAVQRRQLRDRIPTSEPRRA